MGRPWRAATSLAAYGNGSSGSSGCATLDPLAVKQRGLTSTSSRYVVLLRAVPSRLVGLTLVVVTSGVCTALKLIVGGSIGKFLWAGRYQ